MTTATHPDALLIALGSLMDQAISISGQIIDRIPEGISFDDEDDRIQAAVAPIPAIIKNIEAMAAHTPDGEAVKSRAQAWLVDGKFEAAAA